jgi:DNA-binding response OmpR family regulator
MKHKIIIIEDDREACEELRELLASEGYAVRAAFNGLDGLALLQERGCELLLLDLKLPGLSGEGVLERLSAEGPKPKVLILTARLLEGALAEESPAGKPGWELVSEVISKPFHIDTLLDKVKHLLD